MDEILGNIYCWFEFLFGQNLGEYLWGYDCSTQAYGGKNLFNIIGFITLSVSLLFVLGYYYAINHPRFSRWWHWLIVLIGAGIINLFIAYGWTVNDFLNGNICDSLLYERDGDGNIVSQLIYSSDCLLFGVANFFISTMFFIVLSFSFKWGSRNCKHSPFI